MAGLIVKGLPCQAEPCESCPWRIANHSKRTKWQFYTQANLRRLWNQIRRGGGAQTCHPTDPSHPDHIAAGAKPGAVKHECAGSVILVLKEFEKIKAIAGDQPISGEHVVRYRAENPDGLTDTGLAFWMVQRYQLGGTPLIGEAPLPEVNWQMEGIGRPEPAKRAVRS